MDYETIRKCAEVLANEFDEPCNYNTIDGFMENCNSYCKENCDEHVSTDCWEQFLTAKIKEKEKEQ